MNDCELIRDLMPLYADGQASDASRQRIEEHTARCPECKKLLTDMCAPLEPEPEDRTEEIMERVYRKFRRQKTKNTVIAILAAVVALWLVLETVFPGTLLYVASENEEKILRQVPELALTEAELALVDTLFEIPEIRDSLSGSYEDSTDLDPTALAPYLSGICPENGQITDVIVMGPEVLINIIVENRYICLVYSDEDQTGNIDLIYKILAISKLDRLEPDGPLGKLKAHYELTHAVGTNMTQCQKIKSRHMWFSFIDFLTDD